MQEQIENFETKMGTLMEMFDMPHLLDNFIEDLYASNKEMVTEEVVNSSVYANTVMFTNIIVVLLENKQIEAAHTICENTHYFIILNSIMIDIVSLEKDNDRENSENFFDYSNFIFEFLNKNMI